MSWTVSDEEFSAYSGEVLRARPLGSLAASLMGVSAIAVLSSALFFVRPAPLEAPQSSVAAAAPPSAPVEASASSSLQAEIFSPTQSPVPVATRRSAAFDLDAPDLAKEKKAYSTQQNEGGGRQDTLSFGEFDGGKLYLRLDVVQTSGGKLGNSDFYLDMARHAAQADLAVTRIGPPTSLPSRFGAFEAADIRLSPMGAEGSAPGATGERFCLAVRLTSAKAAVEVAGLACGAAGKTFDRRALGCLLDHLHYVPGGEDKKLEGLFPKPEAARAQDCLATGALPATAASGAPQAAKAPAKKRAAGARP